MRATSYCLRRNNKSSFLNIPISHRPWESVEFPTLWFWHHCLYIYIYLLKKQIQSVSVIIFVPDGGRDDYHCQGTCGHRRNHRTETCPALWSIQRKNRDEAQQENNRTQMNTRRAFWSVDCAICCLGWCSITRDDRTRQSEKEITHSDFITKCQDSEPQQGFFYLHGGFTLPIHKEFRKNVWSVRLNQEKRSKVQFDYKFVQGVKLIRNRI